MGKERRSDPGVDLEGLLGKRPGAKRGVVGDVFAANLHIDQVARDRHANATNARDINARAGIDHDPPSADRLYCQRRVVGEVFVGTQADQATWRSQPRTACAITLQLDRLANQPDLRRIDRLAV